MFEKVDKVLLLAPHPDDIEFGMGGTLALLKSLNKEIHVVVFSNCEKSTPQNFHKGVIMEEFHESMKFYNIDKEHIHVYDFAVREFPNFRQNILEILVELRNSIKPDMVFTPSSSDIHQDHATIYQESLRCFKFTNLLGYEMPWNNIEYKSFFYVRLNQEQLDIKTKELSIYKSQQKRSYSDHEFVESLARIRGIQVNTKYAEAFEVSRLIL
jgi:LmbE family N-acetylglucosaminyl deacetylase